MASVLTTSDGTDLAFETTGTGPPVVFVHGSNGGLDSWADVARHVSGFQVVRYARRNHPPSAVGASSNSFAVEAADLECVLEVVTDSSGTGAHVVGGSYGATVALHAALADMDRIASLALFEPPLLLSGEHLVPVLDRYRRLCADARYADAVELFAREVACVPSELVEAASFEVESEEIGRISTLSAGADLEAMAHDGRDFDRWAAITVPVLLMQGALSWPPLPEGMDRLAEVLPHARRVVWPDQSHFATATVPERVAQTLQSFFATA
ncbi:MULTISPECIES: alpha/beta fold hydrolase [Mycolicibacterium]|uniref:Putative hydrolase n=1 Tax=Mycolicibacterium senegalense TaxID=1796 RepID=A0A378W4K8_9MYCO|nr:MULTISPECIES: alpha/beta hydrolase [Mycolicibacterium]MCV7334351.1 alpha/beta hydrolase [Mycolicibacterium senegalense]QZA25300.1 alpha/beta hydrolase [Mycolicibacterium senegalense]CDP85706.1 putative hydrolase [Mycolicibacterium farcinogenes]SUA28083.1 putative hydrolase [Mycolicibacterium senegalense]